MAAKIQPDLEYLLAQARRIEEHREAGAEAEIRKAYRALLKDLKAFISDTYVKYAEMLLPFIPQGMSGAIYTQTTDVEGEVNGFVTYDRKVVKMDVERIRAINQKVINALAK